jgi:RNA polymerase sigma-70 factor (ECF subfamily)
MSVNNLLDSLFRKHKKELVYYAEQRASHVADDLVQESFLQLISHPDLSTIDNHRAYLYKITNNLLKLHYRKLGIQAKYHEDLDDFDTLPATVSDPEMLLHHQQLLTQCLLALQELSPIQRSIFFLHRLDGLTYPEIAKMFGISKATAERHFVAAMEVCVSISLSSRQFK